MQTLGVAVLLTTIGLLSVMLGAARLPSYLSADTILNTRPRDAALVLFFLFTYLLPIFLIRQAILTVGKPSLFQVLTTSLQAFCIVGGNMSVCLHRYFAHQAFKTTRLMQVAICIAGCCAYQGNPLWWASKHRRHHKHCDGPEDPHSWKQTSYLYAWLGWTVNPAEMSIDEEFVGSLGSFPELRVVGAVWWLWPLLFARAVYKFFGFYNMVLYASTPFLLARVVTLLFNVEYHPPHQPSRLDTSGSRKVTCMSLDMPRVLADCVGESCHDDHHAHPKRAKRPSGGFPYADLPYWFVIKPLLLLGLAWSPANNYSKEDNLDAKAH